MSLRHSVLFPLLAAVVASMLSSVRAHDNGMDMSMDGSMDLAEGQMLPYLHFTRGDIVLFYGWVPSTKKAMVGACIGMFLLALVERWIAACRGLMEAHWRKRYVVLVSMTVNPLLSPTPRHIVSTYALFEWSHPNTSCRAQIVQADRINLPTTGEKKPSLTTGGVRAAFTVRNAPPFVFSHDLARGLLHAVQAALQFAFMLIVMYVCSSTSLAMSARRGSPRSLRSLLRTFQVAFILSIVIGLGVGETLFGRFASHAAVHG